MVEMKNVFLHWNQHKIWSKMDFLPDSFGHKIFNFLQKKRHKIIIFEPFFTIQKLSLFYFSFYTIIFEKNDFFNFCVLKKYFAFYQKI